MSEETRASARVLICGATGYLGRYLVREAHDRGHFVRALVRRESGLGEARAACDDVFVGQATDFSTLGGMCDDIDVVVSALGNRTLKRKPTFWEVDYGANLSILRRALSAEVKQLIFVSVLDGAQHRGAIPQVEARERVVDELKRSDIGWTVIRPSGFFNDMAEFFHMARKTGTVWLPGAGTTRFNPIHGADLAKVTLDGVGEQHYGREIPAGGPDVLSLRQVGELAFAALGKEPRFRSFPAWLMPASARLLKPFNENVASLIAMFAAFSGADAVTDQHGTHHLADFYRELAQAG